MLADAPLDSSTSHLSLAPFQPGDTVARKNRPIPEASPHTVRGVTAKNGQWLITTEEGGSWHPACNFEHVS